MYISLYNVINCILFSFHLPPRPSQLFRHFFLDHVSHKMTASDTGHLLNVGMHVVFLI